jgi:hypothetical protein
MKASDGARQERERLVRRAGWGRSLAGSDGEAGRLGSKPDGGVSENLPLHAGEQSAVQMRMLPAHGACPEPTHDPEGGTRFATWSACLCVTTLPPARFGVTTTSTHGPIDTHVEPTARAPVGAGSRLTTPPGFNPNLPVSRTLLSSSSHAVTSVPSSQRDSPRARGSDVGAPTVAILSERYWD